MNQLLHFLYLAQNYSGRLLQADISSYQPIFVSKGYFAELFFSTVPIHRIILLLKVSVSAINCSWNPRDMMFHITIPNNTCLINLWFLPSEILASSVGYLSNILKYGGALSSNPPCAVLAHNRYTFLVINLTPSCFFSKTFCVLFAFFGVTPSYHL